MVSHARKISENLIPNGKFAESLIGWVAERARSDGAGRLSQTVTFKDPGAVNLAFDISDYYGVGNVSLSGSTSRHLIDRAGHYEVNFTIEKVDPADLIFTAQGPFDLDNVKLYAQAKGKRTALLTTDEEEEPKPNLSLGYMRVVLASILILSFFATSALGAEEAAHTATEQVEPKGAPSPKKAVTTAIMDIDLADLSLMLEPMTKTELGIEAQGWFDRLRSKMRQISDAELAVRRKNREVSQLEEVQAAATNVSSAKAGVTKKVENGSPEQIVTSKDLAEAQRQLETAVNESNKTADATVANSPPADAAPTQAPVDAKDVTATEGVRALAQAATAVGKTASAGPIAAPAGVSTTQAEQLSDKIVEAQTAKTEAKAALINYSTQLANERIAIGDRLKLVLDSWEVKGGDPQEYRLYMASVGGLKLDVEDKAAAFTRIKAWLIADEGGLRLAGNLAIFAAYLLGSFAVAWGVRRFLRGVLTRARMSSKLLRDFVVLISGRAVVFIGILLGLSALEVNLAPILAVIGAAGFVVAFALQGTLSNLASGLLILVNKPFDVGDEVLVGSGIKGRVSAVSIFSSVIETDEGFKQIVPNNTIWAGVIANYTTGVVANVAKPEPMKGV